MGRSGVWGMASVCALFGVVACSATVPSESEGHGTSGAPGSGASATDASVIPGASSGGSSSGSESDAGDSGSAPGIAFGLASTVDALNAGQFTSRFDVRTTDDLLVQATLGSSYEGQSVGLNFVSPSGGTLAGYVTVVTDGQARFDVKLAGTVVGRTGQTGTFPLVLGHIGTQTALARTSVTLVKGGTL